VRIWEVATGQERAALQDRNNWAVAALAVAPDGSWLASGSWGGTVRIWDVATGQERATLTGHTSSAMALAVTAVAPAVTAVAVAPDGSWLASGSDDGTVRIWDVATWQVQALMRLESSVKATAWLGSNALVVGGSAGLYLFGFYTGTHSATAAH
jgi:WD40 repeat protein